MPAHVHRFHIEKDAVDGAKHIMDASVPRGKLQDISKYVKASQTTATTIGVSGSPVTLITLEPEAGFTDLIPLTAKVTVSGLGTAESATAHLVATLDDGSTVTLASKTSGTGGTQTITITQADMDFTVISSGRRITKLEVTVESSATSTSATATGDLVALEC